MLANRNRTLADIADLGLSVDSSSLLRDDSMLSLDDLKILGRFFKQPWSSLLVSEPEVLRSVGHDNRTFMNRLRPLAPDTFDVVMAVTDMLDAAADLFPDTVYEVPPGLSANAHSETVGAEIRHFLNVTEGAQLSLHDDFGALRLWGNALQNRGVYVAQRSLKDDSIRAFSRVDGPHAVVVVDTQDLPRARIFSLLHEYAHLILRTPGICDLDDHTDIERHCNEIAAAVLMPNEMICTLLAGRRFDSTAQSNDEVLQEMSRKLRVSQASLLIRLRDVGILSQTTYDTIEERRANRRSDSSKSPGGQYYPTQINRVGRRYARNVLGALDAGAINTQDASSLLEIREHNLGRYRTELEQ
jgi:Zn-dependent peptidase ImmA (M78 family)